jgi:hypothetical protein
VSTHRQKTDSGPAEYLGELCSLWSSWEPHLAQAERFIHRSLAGADSEFDTVEELISTLRRIQYRAHAATELASGLTPPPSASNAHGYLVAALDASRDSLGALAEHLAEEHPDPRALAVVLEALRISREAFKLARASTGFAGATSSSSPGEPFSPIPAVRMRPRAGMVAAWLLVVLCSGLLTALIYEIVRA